MSYQRKNPEKVKLKWAYWVIGGLVFWLFLSSIAGLSPIKTIGAIPAYFMGKPTDQMVKRSEMDMRLAEKDSLITELESKLPKYTESGQLIGAQGMVNIDSDKLNVRSGPSLSNKIILKIPDSSEVDILEYDDEVYYLQGKQGKWCKIRYIDVEGWAWGNYIEIKN